MSQSERERILILGAAGRDFHNFNAVFRDDPSVEVVAFTATQIPGIEERRYPPQLSGPHHPNGIPQERGEGHVVQVPVRGDVDPRDRGRQGERMRPFAF